MADLIAAINQRAPASEMIDAGREHEPEATTEICGRDTRVGWPGCGHMPGRPKMWIGVPGPPTPRCLAVIGSSGLLPAGIAARHVC